MVDKQSAGISFYHRATARPALVPLGDDNQGKAIAGCSLELCPIGLGLLSGSTGSHTQLALNSTQVQAICALGKVCHASPCVLQEMGICDIGFFFFLFPAAGQIWGQIHTHGPLGRNSHVTRNDAVAELGWHQHNGY